jgi:hypothetical protein
LIAWRSAVRSRAGEARHAALRPARSGRAQRPAFLLALVLIALAGCSGSITDLEIDTGATPIRR